MKGIGNSTTIKFDVEDRETAYKILLSLVESVAQRLRKARNCCMGVSIEIRNSGLFSYSRQPKPRVPTKVTSEIYEIAKELFDEC
ncbi:MAG: polymerase [Clostridiales bacterium]|nr:polymerase [Clostridiales bacterium]